MNLNDRQKVEFFDQGGPSVHGHVSDRVQPLLGITLHPQVINRTGATNLSVIQDRETDGEEEGGAVFSGNNPLLLQLLHNFHNEGCLLIGVTSKQKGHRCYLLPTESHSSSS